MSRLWRPHIPIMVRCQVAARQLGAAVFEQGIFREEKESASKFLARQLTALAAKLGCTVKDLHLDHDPPLAARPRFRRGLGRKTYYQPAANDPAHLFYRPHGPEFEGSHDVKTRIRGDHGQYSDLALIRREKRRQEKKKPARSDVVSGRGEVRHGKFTSRPLTSCARGAACHCKGDPERWRRRKSACGNWRTAKIGGGR